MAEQHDSTAAGEEPGLAATVAATPGPGSGPGPGGKAVSVAAAAEPDADMELPSPPGKRPRTDNSVETPSHSSNRLRKINYPKKRANVACDICRSRKTRCDAAKPKCSFCQDVGAECSYRGKANVGTSQQAPTPEEDTAEREPEPPAPPQSSSSENEIITSLRRIESLLRQPGQTNSIDLEQLVQQVPFPTPETLPHPPPSSHASSSHAPPAAHPSPGDSRDEYARQAKSTVGLDLSGSARLSDGPIPPELLPFVSDDTEEELELELQGQSIFDGPIVQLKDLPRDPRHCWLLEQHFSRDVLPWCPIIDQQASAEVVSRAVESGFDRTNGDTRLALFILAIGSFSHSSNHVDDNAATFPGLDYFHAANELLDADRARHASIEHVQCHIFASFYLLYALRPLQAYHAIRRASETMVFLLRLRRRLDADPTLRELVHRAYWACYLIEHELQAYIPEASRALHELHETVPLPMSSYDEPGIYWFTAEIALRRIFARPRHGAGWNLVHTVDEPAVTNEVSLQMGEWHASLPGPISFPLGSSDGNPASIRPLMDPRKVFLRAQYYALQAFIRWPGVVQILSDTAQPSQVVVATATESLRMAVLHIHAVAPLFHSRHMLLLASFVGHYVMMLALLCSYKVQRLDDLGVAPMEVEETIRVGWRAMKTWESNLTVRMRVRKFETLMRSKGIPFE